MGCRPAPKRGEAGRGKRAERKRSGGFVVVERAFRNLGIEVPGHDIEPGQGVTGLDRLKLLTKPPGAVDRLRHVLAALARQRVGIVLEPAYSLRRCEVLALHLGVELGDDPIELRERATQPLPVLLRELRRL